MIALCGCMMQEPEVVEKIKEELPLCGLDFRNPQYLSSWRSCWNERFMRRRRWWSMSGKELMRSWRICRSERKYTFKSGVNIMFGCNNFCSYCIVPYVRGRERSREPEDIIREIEELVKMTASWRVMLSRTECQLLRKEPGIIQLPLQSFCDRVEKIEGLERIRFMTSHPKDLSDELIEVMAAFQEDLPPSASAASVRQQRDLKER